MKHAEVMPTAREPEVSHMNRTSLTLMLTLLAAPVVAEVESSRHETFTLAKGGVVAIDNVNGSITIEAWDRDQVQLDAKLSARTQAALDQIEINIDATANRVAISTDLTRTRDGWNDQRRVDYTLMVPRGARLDEVESVNGAISITGVGGGTKASTVNGKLELMGTRGDVEAEAVNGSISVDFADLASTRKISVESVNGSVKIDLPSLDNLDVDVETLNGPIVSGLGLEVERPEHGPGRWMRGRLGSAATHLSVETVNGEISIN